jgi:hypothetical protein
VKDSDDEDGDYHPPGDDSEPLDDHTAKKDVAVSQILDMDLCRDPLRRYAIEDRKCPFCNPSAIDWDEEFEAGDNEFRKYLENAKQREEKVTGAVKRQRRKDFTEKIKKSREEWKEKRKEKREQGQEERMAKRERRWKGPRDLYLERKR